MITAGYFWKSYNDDNANNDNDDDDDADDEAHQYNIVIDMKHSGVFISLYSVISCLKYEYITDVTNLPRHLSLGYVFHHINNFYIISVIRVH